MPSPCYSASCRAAARKYHPRYVFQNRFQVTPKSFKNTFSVHVHLLLAIQLAHHDIEHAEQRDEVRDLGADAHLLEAGDVDE
jgi:hypothetical protein